MSNDPALLIDGCLDDMLTSEQHVELSAWINVSPENARMFAEATMLHDQMRNEIMSGELPRESGRSARRNAEADTATNTVTGGRSSYEPGNMQSVRRQSVRSFLTLLATGSLICVAVVLFFKGFTDSSAAAAAGELQRLIELTARSMDRTYQITVEETVLPRRGRRRPAPEDARPPKAPIDGATLSVRDDQQFVLSRVTDAGPFVTGSNGTVSWAVRPVGSVRYSSDLNRFNRDVPGHEHGMSLVNLHDGLERLRQAYDVQLLPLEDADTTGSATRLLVAVRHPGERGPKRVEISYEVESSLIRQVRFVEMPYGPESLTLRLTLLSDEPVGKHFFDHESHHAADRRVEME